MPKKNKLKSSSLLRRRDRPAEKPVKKFKSETENEAHVRLKKKKPAKKLSNKIISYVYIAHYLRQVNPSQAKLDEINGSTLRGARPDKIIGMVKDKIEKLLKPIDKLLDKNGVDHD